ncbi:MAG: hypothetical protein ACPG4Z_03815 [Chitinophagales bacterium]
MRYKILLISFFFFCTTQAQTFINKEKYEKKVDNIDNEWVYASHIRIEVPKELQEFVANLHKEVLEGNIQVEKFCREYCMEYGGSLISPKIANISMSADEVLDEITLIDTVWRIHPNTLEDEQLIVKNDPFEIITSSIEINESWAFNKNNNTLTSTIYSISPKFQFFDSAGNYTGDGSVYQKINEDITSKETKTFTINRTMDFDTVTYTLYPLKLLYNRTLNNILIQNIDDLTLIDDIGNIIEDNQDAITVRDSVWQINPITLQEFEIEIQSILPEDWISHFEIKEEWAVDFNTFNIEKNIKSIKPILYNYNDMGDYLGLSPAKFTIVFY